MMELTKAMIQPHYMQVSVSYSMATAPVRTHYANANAAEPEGIASYVGEVELFAAIPGIIAHLHLLQRRRVLVASEGGHELQSCMGKLG